MAIGDLGNNFDGWGRAYRPRGIPDSGTNGGVRLDLAISDLSYSTSGCSESYTMVNQLTSITQSPRFQVPTMDYPSRNLWSPGF